MPFLFFLTFFVVIHTIPVVYLFSIILLLAHFALSSKCHLKFLWKFQFFFHFIFHIKNNSNKIMCFFKIILTITTLRYRFPWKLSWLTWSSLFYFSFFRAIFFDITCKSILNVASSLSRISYFALVWDFIFRTVFVQWAQYWLSTSLFFIVK